MKLLTSLFSCSLKCKRSPEPWINVEVCEHSAIFRPIVLVDLGVIQKSGTSEWAAANHQQVKMSRTATLKSIR